MHSNKELIIIDFDETLYKKDSLIAFCKFIYKKKPTQLWAIFPQLIGSILHTFKLISTKKFKELFLLFLITQRETTNNLQLRSMENHLRQRPENIGMMKNSASI